MYLADTKCGDARVYVGDSGGAKECGDLCLATSGCKFFGVNEWDWCRLTTTCDQPTPDGKYDTYELVEGPTTTAIATTTPTSNEWFLYKADTKCGDARVYTGNSHGVSGCADECLATTGCKFFSINEWYWCRLTMTCDQPLPDAKYDTYELVQATTTIITATTISGWLLYQADTKCNDERVYSGNKASVEDCADECLATTGCKFFSMNKWGWCRLTATCDVPKPDTAYDTYEIATTTTTSFGVDSLIIYMAAAKCKGSAISAQKTISVQACADICQATSSCNFFSVNTWFWCKLTETCDPQADASYNIYAKDAASRLPDEVHDQRVGK